MPENLPLAVARTGSASTWAMLIKRVYEVDPLECPKRGGTMKIISFRSNRGQQRYLVEPAIRHCGLWERPTACWPVPVGRRGGLRPPSDEPELVMDPKFLESERLERRGRCRVRMQLILDPAFW